MLITNVLSVLRRRFVASIYIRQVSEELARNLRVKAAQDGISIKQLVVDTLEALFVAGIAAETPEPDYGKEARNGPVGPPIRKRTK
jgi:hypothetical protein